MSVTLHRHNSQAEEDDVNRTHTGHRMTKTGLAEESFAITVDEVGAVDAPLVYRVTDDDDKTVPVHTFDDKFWSPCDQDAVDHEHMMLENQISRHRTSGDYRSAVQSTFDRYLVIDGLLHRQVCAPIYEMIYSPYSQSHAIWATADPHPIVSASQGTYAPHEADQVRRRAMQVPKSNRAYVERKLSLIERL